MEEIKDPRRVTRKSIETFLKSNANFTVDHLYNGSVPDLKFVFFPYFSFLQR